MDGQLLGTLTVGDYKANIYGTNAPSEFRIAYQDGSGKILEEAPLTGVSTYRQREAEILGRLQQLSEGAKPERTPYLGDAGEY